MLGCGIEVLALFTLVSAVHGIFQHANLQLRLGPLNHFFRPVEIGIPGLAAFPMTWWAQIRSPFRWQRIQRESARVRYSAQP